ncbi:MAG: adenylate/guanylate cyclase domain-containing protein [Candidatus Anstonellales archaeon]
MSFLNLSKTDLAIFLILYVVIIYFIFNNSFIGINNFITDKLYEEKTFNKDKILIVGIDEKTLNHYGWPIKRAFYAKAIEKLDNASVIAFDIGFFSKNDDDNILEEAINKSNATIIMAAFYDDNKILAPILNAKYQIGLANVLADEDGVIRAVPLNLSHYMIFSQLIATSYLKSNISLPNDSNSLNINFLTRPGGFKSISFYDLLNDKINESFDSKIILIGATAETLHDNYFVPTSNGNKMSGIEIHANALMTIMAKSFLTRQDKISISLTCFIIGLLIFIIPKNASPYYAVAYSFIIWFAYLFIVALAFNAGLIMNIIYPTLTIILMLSSSSLLSAIKEKEAKERIKDIFGRYVSRDIANFIIEKYETGDINEERYGTVIFTDIRGFTALSESMKAKDVIKMLNIYIGNIAEIAERNEGVVNKYMGDAVMILFNAPFDVNEHEKKACKTALEIKEAISKINKDNGKSIDVGIGINTGSFIAGNIGSKQRLEYTVIGDSINISSRLESLTKLYGVNIIISENTKKAIDDKDFICRYLDVVILKGKTKPIKIYELRDRPYNKDWDKAMDLYKKGMFKHALVYFDKLAKLGDKPAVEFAKRCRHFIKNKPTDWTGVYKLDIK